MKRLPLPVLDAALSLGVLAPPLALQGIGDGSREVGEKIADKLPGWL